MSSPDWFVGRAAALLDRRIRSGTLRSRCVHETLDATTLVRNGRRFLSFASNDYLGLSRHPQVIRAAVEAIAGTERWGSGAAPLVTGRSAEHARLEQALTQWKQGEAALTFSSGFAGHFGVIAGLVGRDDLIFSDALNHACLIDGCRLSGAENVTYPSRDLDFLREALRARSAARRRGVGWWLVSDSVFSMHGTLAPIEGLVELCAEFEMRLIVDEAHASGVYGEEGRGLLSADQADRASAISLGTCSKALGSIGGFAVADSMTIEYLLQRARSYIYSTAAPPAAAAATAAAIEICRSVDDRREHLGNLAQQLRKRLRELGFANLPEPNDVTADRCPIVPIWFDSLAAAEQAGARLIERDVHVPLIRPPTVPAGTQLLRVSLNSDHQIEHIDRLADILGAIV